MEKYIEEELAGRTPEEVEELNIDNCKASHISGLTDKFVNLETLSIANCELTSLKGFPSLPNLKKLDLSDNRLSGGLEVLANCTGLEYIGLSGNPIEDISVLEPLKKLAHLQSVEVFNCDIAGGENYRGKIFELLDNVLYVDGMDRDGHTAPDDYDGEDGGSNEEDDEEDSEGGVPDDDEGSEDEEGSEEEDDEPHGTKRKHEDEESTDA